MCSIESGTPGVAHRLLNMAQELDTADELAGIARYEVSEDGIAWRPYNPKEDAMKMLHKRIEFASDPADDGFTAACP